MNYRQWGMVLAFLLLIGCAQVWQRTAVVMRGYAVGAQVSEIHARRTQVAWLETNVIEMSSPTYLAAVARDRELKLVAWERLKPADEGRVPLLQLAAMTSAFPTE